MIFFPAQFPAHSAHLADVVEIHYRWHPLNGRPVRRLYSERRAGNLIDHVEAFPGVVVMVPRWMLDPIACVGMEIGAPRVALSALADLHRILIERGFRKNFPGDSTIVREKLDEQYERVDSGAEGAANGSAPTQDGVPINATGDGPSARARPRDRSSRRHLPAIGGRRQDDGAR